MDKAQVKILIVDDEAALCLGIQETLRREGYLVDGVTDPLAALRKIEAHLYNLVLSDIKMPQVSGLDLLTHVKRRAPDTVVILMTAYGTVESAVRAMKDGAYDYLTKPLDTQRLRALVQKALEYQALVAENHELRSRLRATAEPSLLVGHSQAIQRVRQAIGEIAPSDVTVLIEGESGTGKELVARSIHLLSPRHDRPFVSVNCAALPEHLLESELFGHVKGAFTGAVTARSGRFHQAGHGTLFLDEIGDLSPKGQGDLLRVVEEGTFQKVGGSEIEQSHARLIAATNRNLEELVRTGRFREDLFYRLSVFPIRVPPLRERPEDIPVLMTTFMDHFAARHRRRRKRLDPQVLAICQRYSWPGNVRQLRNVVERLVITGAGPVAGPESLPEFLRGRSPAPPATNFQPGITLKEAERLMIHLTLKHVGFNRTEAARLLGISRRTLQYKLKAYALPESAEAAAAGAIPADSTPPEI